MNDKKLDVIISKLAGMESNISDLKSEMHEVKGEVSSLKSRMDGMQSEISGMRSQMDGMQNEMSGMKSQMNGMQNEMSGMKSQMYEMQNEMSGMKSRTDGMQSEMSAMKSQLEENTQITKAIHHRQSESDARLEGFSLEFAKLHGEVVSTNEKLEKLIDDQKSISELIGEHEISIRTLRRRPI